MRIPPLRLDPHWLYRRMYFDELYYSVFVAITMGLSRLSAWFDRYVVDGLVNLAGWTVEAGVGRRRAARQVRRRRRGERRRRR